MCGIAGFTSPDSATAEHVVRAMTGAIAHRGPDGDGCHITQDTLSGRAIALGHRRLSIIDLATGDQPIFLEDGRYSIVFNGEIYNYVELREDLKAVGRHFRTTSDTEVLLTAYAEWGEACLPRLRGMFAFAIWDKQDNRLFLARDPFGKKPLLYFRKRTDIVFASEFTALVCHPDFDATIDPQALAQYLIWKYVPGENTLVASVSEVPPGHYAEWHNGEFNIAAYYSVPEQISDPERCRALSPGTISEFRVELEDAIRIRLRSDVPLGAFLSGGIDSSAIVALMAQETQNPIKTFSVGFHEEKYSELWAARMVAEHYRTDHHEIKITPDDFINSIETVSWQRGAPLSEMADIPLYFLSKLASEHVKVVLSGEGSDELLAGYPKHWGDLLVSKYHNLTPRFFDKAIDGLRAILPYSQYKLAILLRAAKERDFVVRQAAWFGLMEEQNARRLAPRLFEGFQPFNWSEDRGANTFQLSRALHFDKTVWLPGTLLERGDRMTMAASIEGRMPFMDTKLCEFVSTLAPDAFLQGRVGKFILREAMKNDLPSDILTRSKAGFRVPMHEWLRGRLKDYAYEMLFSSNSVTSTWCEARELKNLWNEHQSKIKNREKELWSLMTLEIFLRQLSEHSRKFFNTF